MATIKNARVQIPRDPEYAGKRDYQGNHDIFEMPEGQKPPRRSIPKLPLNRIALGIIVVGIVVLLLLVCVSIMQQSTLIG